MAENDIPPARRAWISIVTGILSVGNVMAAGFGLAMLVWALQEMGYNGKQWGFLGILLFSFAALPGNPLSALTGFSELVLPAIRRLSGFDAEFCHVTLKLPLGRSVSSKTSRASTRRCWPTAAAGRRGQTNED